MTEKIAYSYVLEHDTGFAPNPFFDYLTLAGCKPLLWGKKGIRKEVPKEFEKNHDVWIFANAGNNLLLENYEYKNGKLEELPLNCDSYHRLVYAFKVKEVLTFEEYYKNPCFSNKRRKFASSHRGTFGDNNLHSHKICDKDHSKHYIEDPIVEFSNGKLIEKSCQIKLVINVDNVLISGKNQFYYFGCFAPKILGNLDKYFKKGIRNRTIRDESIINEIVGRIEEISDPGIYGFPSFHTSKDYREFANNSNYLREIYNECFDTQTKKIINDWITKVQDKKVKNHAIKSAI